MKPAKQDPHDPANGEPVGRWQGWMTAAVLIGLFGAVLSRASSLTTGHAYTDPYIGLRPIAELLVLFGTAAVLQLADRARKKVSAALFIVAAAALGFVHLGPASGGPGYAAGLAMAAGFVWKEMDRTMVRQGFNATVLIIMSWAMADCLLLAALHL